MRAARLKARRARPTPRLSLAPSPRLHAHFLTQPWASLYSPLSTTQPASHHQSPPSPDPWPLDPPQHSPRLCPKFAPPAPHRATLAPVPHLPVVWAHCWNAGAARGARARLAAGAGRAGHRLSRREGGDGPSGLTGHGVVASARVCLEETLVDSPGSQDTFSCTGGPSGAGAATSVPPHTTQAPRLSATVELTSILPSFPSCSRR